jgi:hypothetical protein
MPAPSLVGTMAVALSLFAAAACARDRPVEATHASAGAVVGSASAAPSAPSPAERCLPVVAASCGCVYSCAAGLETAPDTWSVSHPFWATPIIAQIASWCVDGACTDAFHGEITCNGICPPRPADPTCRFEGDACVSARDAAP